MGCKTNCLLRCIILTFVHLLVFLCELFFNAWTWVMLRLKTDHLMQNLCGRIPTKWMSSSWHNYKIITLYPCKILKTLNKPNLLQFPTNTYRFHCICTMLWFYFFLAQKFQQLKEYFKAMN
jgi:hypothetical protein